MLDFPDDERRFRRFVPRRAQGIPRLRTPRIVNLQRGHLAELRETEQYVHYETVLARIATIGAIHPGNCSTGRTGRRQRIGARTWK
jgi:hypothetical protein